MQVSSAFSVCSASSLLPLLPESLLFLPSASISSMNMMQGPLSFFALANSLRTRAAPVPAYFSTKSDPEQCSRGTSAMDAVARARVVLPITWKERRTMHQINGEYVRYISAKHVFATHSMDQYTKEKSTNAYVIWPASTHNISTYLYQEGLRVEDPLEDVRQPESTCQDSAEYRPAPLRHAWHYQCPQYHQTSSPSLHPFGSSFERRYRDLPPMIPLVPICLRSCRDDK
mmetsp:Transcript_13732/g.27855  ORF Transcript_13732/g.27855 Transcript_13732/m.27855 type:complete len:229 (+) Transcript_13732:588-1274(+)